MNTKSIITDDETRKTEKLNYSRPLEQLIRTKAEECEVLSKLHLMCHKKYDKLEIYFNVPVITMTAVIGFVSALNIQFKYINIIIGVCSLVVSLIKSMFAYLKISQKNENHRVAYLQYYQISNEIRIELSLARNIRQPANYLLNLIKIKMKNLNEVSELIDNIIIQKYIDQNSQNSHYYKIGHPDILDDIRPIEICDWDIDNNNKIQKEEPNSKEEQESDNEDIKKDIERIKRYEEVAKTDIEIGKINVNSKQPSPP
jgi:hypothetical protein